MFTVLLSGTAGSGSVQWHPVYYAIVLWDLSRRHTQQKLVPETMVTDTAIMYHKLARKIWRKFITVSRTKTTLRPITLHGSCHVPHSFCAGIELCSIPYQKLVPEKNWYQIDRHTCKFLVPDDWYQFLVRVSPALRNSSYVWIIRNQLAAMLLPWTCPLALVHVSSLQCRIITNYDSCLSYTYTPVLRCNARQSCLCRRPGTCPEETWTAAGPLGQQATTPSRGTGMVWCNLTRLEFCEGSKPPSGPGRRARSWPELSAWFAARTRRCDLGWSPAGRRRVRGRCGAAASTMTRGLVTWSKPKQHHNIIISPRAKPLP